jgi:hypothetical protein
MFPEELGRDVEFASSVCEIKEPAIREKNLAELAFDMEGDYMWTSWSDVKSADACLAKVGSRLPPSKWQGQADLGCPRGIVEGCRIFRGIVEYVVFAEHCWGYGTFYGIDNPQLHKDHDGIAPGSAAGRIRRAWYLCPVTQTSESVLHPLDLETTGSNISWKFMGRVTIDDEEVLRSFTCILDTCPDVPDCPGGPDSAGEILPGSFNAVEDCYRKCPPGQAPSLDGKKGELALAGTDEIVQCRNRNPVETNKCAPFPCKSPVDMPGVNKVEDYDAGKYGKGACNGEDITNGTVCYVGCRSFHHFFDNEYDGTELAAELYADSLPFQCTSGVLEMFLHPSELTFPLASSPRGVLGSEYQCMLMGSTATTVEAVTATMGLTMPKADVAMLLENEAATIAALEKGLSRAIASTEATVKVLPPLSEAADVEEAPALRRLQESAEPYDTSILRAQFVAYSESGTSSPADITAALVEFRSDEDAMKAQFMQAFNDAKLPVTILGVSMSEPTVINYNVVKKPDKDVEQLTRERMRTVALIGASVSAAVIVLCIFWQQIKPCIKFVLHKINCVRIARELKEKRAAKKREKKMAKKQKSLQVEFVP